MSIVVCSLGNGFAQPPEVADDVTAARNERPFDRDLYLESFDVVWRTVHETHWDPEGIGEQWLEARETYRPKMEEAESVDEAIDILHTMIMTLGQSHFSIIPSSAYEQLEQQRDRGGPGFSGLEFRWIDEQLVVTRVRDDSPAEQAGIGTGWVLQQVENRTREQTVTIEELVDELRQSQEGSLMRFETLAAFAAQHASSGEIGDELTLTLLDEQDSTQEISLTLVPGPGNPSQLGNLPLTYVEIESEILEQGIGYFRFNAFLDAPRVAREFQQIVQNPDVEGGLIIDLRGNIGGLLALAMGLGGWFVDEPLHLGTMTMRNTPLRLALNPRRPKFDRPVAILIDETSVSAAEVLSGGLKDLGVGKVFGAKSAGLVLPANMTKLPSGDGFLYAMAGYETAGGSVLELEGVEPNVEIQLSRAQLFGGNDPILAAAIQWLSTQEPAMNE